MKPKSSELSVLEQLYCIFLFVLISVAYFYYMIPPKEYTIHRLHTIEESRILRRGQIYLTFYEVITAYILPYYLYFKTLEVYCLNKVHFAFFLMVLANVYALNYILYNDQPLLLWKSNALMTHFMLFIYHDHLM